LNEDSVFLKSRELHSGQVKEAFKTSTGELNFQGRIELPIEQKSRSTGAFKDRSPSSGRLAQSGRLFKLALAVEVKLLPHGPQASFNVLRGRGGGQGQGGGDWGVVLAVDVQSGPDALC
jgi:hypothetical protein